MGESSGKERRSFVAVMGFRGKIVPGNGRHICADVVHCVHVRSKRSGTLVGLLKKSCFISIISFLPLNLKEHHISSP